MSLEHLARSVRQTANLSLEQAAREDLDAVLGLHVGRLTVQSGRAEGGTILIFADGTAEIIICHRLRGWERRQVLWHEMGHFLLLEAGMALPYPANNGGNQQRLLGLWDECEEARCRRFVRALRLPAAVALTVTDDYELAELVGCAVDEVRERRHDLIGR